MAKRSPDGSRPYVEAFPGLDALTVERMVKAGRVLCEWVDELGRVIGHVRVLGFDEDMVFDQRFTAVGERLPSKGVRSVEIVRRQHLGTHKRPFFLCKGCGLLVGKIHCVWDQWKCRNCHHLCFMSQRAKAWVRNRMRADYLYRWLSRGEDDFENKREFRRAKKEHGELVTELVGYAHGVIPPGVRAILYPEWLSERRRPELAWDKPDEPAPVATKQPSPPEPQAPSPFPEHLPPPPTIHAPPLPEKRRLPFRYDAAAMNSVEEDPANDGFPARRIWWAP